jgi:hypothetical protein
VQAPAAALDCKLERAKGYVGKHYCLHETRRVHKIPYQLSVLDRARLEKLKEGLNHARPAIGVPYLVAPDAKTQAALLVVRGGKPVARG